MGLISRLHNFTSGTFIIADEVDAELDQIVATINALDTANYKDGSVTAAKIANANVTTPKIADANVTPTKLDTAQTYNVGALQVGGAGTIQKGGSGEYSYGAAFHIFRPANQSGTADVSAASFNVTSDARLKENVRAFNDGLGAVRRLRGVRFTWKESGRDDIGVVAQEVQDVVPEAVSEDAGHLTVNPMPLIAVLLSAVNELAERVEWLENK